MPLIDVRKFANSRLGQKLRARLRAAKVKRDRKRYTRKISKEELRAALLSLGEWKGRVVWVQSSWNEFYNVEIKPHEFLAMLFELVGPDGTLVMPAFPLDPDPSKVLMIDDCPSSTGLLTELLRRHRQAHRSIHIRSSVVAVGPQAEYITRDHHLTEYSWGPGTPYDRIRELDGLLVALGFLEVGFTPIHYAECVLHHEVKRFRSVFKGETTYRWRRRDGTEGTHTFLNRHGMLFPKKLKKGLEPDLYRQVRLSNLLICGMPALPGLARTMELARKGTTWYSVLPI
jgi:aminoglycoside N3'-acetyltransferase